MGINNQKQEAGDQSIQIIAETVHNHSGIQIADVVPIVHGLVKAEMEVYQQMAEIKVRTRFDDFTKTLESKIETKVADKVEKFSDPAMQYAAREATLGYIKSGDPEQKDSLIDLLIERINTEERSSEQLLIDEAIHILPKLSSRCIALLTLMTYSRLRINGAKSVLDSTIRNLNSVIDNVYSAKSIDLEYLLQSGCILLVPIIQKEKGWWLQQNRDNYPLLFSHIDNYQATERFLDKYGMKQVDGGIQFSSKLSQQECINFISCFQPYAEGKLIPTMVSLDKYNEVANKLSPFTKEDILSLLEPRTPMNDQEIISYYSNINPRWIDTIRLMDEKVSHYELNLVGKYIGVLQLRKLLDLSISLDLLI